jgi:hypothetical protein
MAKMMNRGVLIVTLAALVLGGGWYVVGKPLYAEYFEIDMKYPSQLPDASAQKKAQIAVKKLLKDPDSARFADMTRTKADRICGKVSAKNGFGGYGDPLPFVYFVTSDAAMLSTNKEAHQIVCTP